MEKVKFSADMSSFDEWSWYGNPKSVAVVDGLYKIYF